MTYTEANPDTQFPGSSAIRKDDPDLRFHLVMAVWGKKYVNLLLGVALPSLLARGNLPSFAGLAGSRFVIVTRAEDRARIEGSEAIERLKGFMEVRFLEFEPGKDPHLSMSKAHKMAAVEANAERAFVVVLSPDLVMATGSLENVLKLARSGKRAVMIPGLRLTEETGHTLLTKTLATTDGADILEPRALVRFALDHLHPETRQYFWSSDRFNPNPVYCIWPIGDDGLLARCFHLHPLLVDFRGPTALEKLTNDTIDGAFVGHSIGDWSDIHVEGDSDNILVFSFTSVDDRVDSMRPNRASEAVVRALAYAPHVNPLHRMFFTKPLFLHTGGISDRFRAKAEQTGFIAFRILDTLGPIGSIMDALGPRGSFLSGRLPGRIKHIVLSALRSVFRATGTWGLVQRLRGRR